LPPQTTEKGRFASSLVGARQKIDAWIGASSQPLDTSYLSNILKINRLCRS
jgi:hypothetical protein